MNFVFVTFDSPRGIGGIETRIRNYIRVLRDRGHTVHLVVLGPLRGTANDVNERGTTVWLHSSFRGLNQLAYVLGTWVVKASSLFLITGASTIAGPPLLLACRLMGVRTLAMVYGRDLLQARKSPIQRVLMTLSLLLADRVGANSRATRSLLPRYVVFKTSILYPGVVPSPIQSDSHDVSGIIVLYVGRLVKRKGVDDLIIAFSRIVAAHPEARLRVVGDGPERARLQRLAEDLGIGHETFFSGFLTGNELQAAYCSCTFIAVPSRTLRDDVEGFGMVALEAASFGKPAVGTKSGGVQEAILDMETGLLVEEGNVDQLASVMSLLIENGPLRERLGANARKRAEDSFSWEQVTDKLLRAVDCHP